MKPETFAGMYADPGGNQWGRGWRLNSVPALGGTCIEHGGQNGDGRGHWQTGYVRIAPQKNVAIVVNTNAGGQNSLDAVHELRDKLQAEPREVLK